MPFYKDIQFSKEELGYYSQHIHIPELGHLSQQKLKSASVLVVGAGSLGGVVLQYLASAGVGTIGIVDADLVQKQNYQNQILYSKKDIGRFKARAARSRLEAINPHIQVVAHKTALSPDNVFDLVHNYDVVADCSNHLETSLFINDSCVLLNKTDVFASVNKFEGSISVFNYLRETGELGPNLNDFWPLLSTSNTVESQGGLQFGFLAGIIGSLQALEIFKAITDVGHLLSGKMMTINAINLQATVVAPYKAPFHHISNPDIALPNDTYNSLIHN